MILPVDAVPPDALPHRELVALNFKIAEAGKRAGKQAAAADSRPSAGPVVLGLFMACILLNCLIYLVHESKDFWAELHTASFKTALVHDYRDDARSLPVSIKAEKVSLLTVPEDSWHRVAPGNDADELRTALRLAFISRDPRIVQTWQNAASSHRGTVTPTGLADNAGGCRPFHITRTDSTAGLADDVDFCADGSIRQGLK